MKNPLKSIFLIINLKSLIMLVLTLIATYLCIVYQISADFSLALIGIAVVFPVVFSIGEAYKRREIALGHYGQLKALGRSMYFASRDWMEAVSQKDLDDIKDHLKNLLMSCRDFFSNTKSNQSESLEDNVYKRFSDLSRLLQSFRARGLDAGEVSRVNQYICRMLDAFETMKHIYQYRTPRTLRMYSKIFIYTVPILYAPYFAFACKNVLEPMSFVVPVLLTLVLIGLDNIQDQLENPFDQYGEDDIKINAEDFALRLEIE